MGYYIFFHFFCHGKGRRIHVAVHGLLLAHAEERRHAVIMKQTCKGCFSLPGNRRTGHCCHLVCQPGNIFPMSCTLAEEFNFNGIQGIRHRKQEFGKIKFHTCLFHILTYYRSAFY